MESEASQPILNLWGIVDGWWNLKDKTGAGIRFLSIKPTCEALVANKIYIPSSSCTTSCLSCSTTSRLAFKWTSCCDKLAKQPKVMEVSATVILRSKSPILVRYVFTAVQIRASWSNNSTKTIHGSISAITYMNTNFGTFSQWFNFSYHGSAAVISCYEAQKTLGNLKLSSTLRFDNITCMDVIGKLSLWRKINFGQRMGRKRKLDGAATQRNEEPKLENVSCIITVRWNSLDTGKEEGNYWNCSNYVQIAKWSKTGCEICE